jgi:chromosome segregation ATPase
MKKASPMPLPAYPTPNSPWHQTNGQNGGTPERETTPSAAGKTSQVLAKLTSDNDRLRREIKAEKAAKEEALQQYQLLKGRVNRLEEQNGTIQMQFDHNESALARKERRLDDIRLMLDEETARRKRAEEREAEMGRKLGETVSQAAQEVAEAHNAQKAAEAAYDTLKREYTGLEKRIQHLRNEVEAAVKRIDAEKAVHRKQLTQLEVLLDQERNIQEKSNKDVRDMGFLVHSYRATEENVKKLETEMQNTVHEMRWAMRLHQARQPSKNPTKETRNRRPPAA